MLPDLTSIPILSAHGRETFIIAAWRWLIITYAALTGGFVIGRLFTDVNNNPDEACAEGRALHMSLLVGWLFVAATVIESIGKPWLYWRLPLATVYIPATWWAMRWHRQRHHVAPKRVDPWWWPRSVLGSRDSHDRPLQHQRQ